jgi:hypothetical protein
MVRRDRDATLKRRVDGVSRPHVPLKKLSSLCCILTCKVCIESRGRKQRGEGGKRGRGGEGQRGRGHQTLSVFLEAIEEKKCTFSVTGQRCYFQYLWVCTK